MRQRADRVVVRVLQALVIGLPLFLGGRQTSALTVASVAVLGLLAFTLWQRRQRGGPAAPGVVTLGAFVVVALATTMPLPPALLGLLDPATARLTATMLPGWPAAGVWTAWRPLALDPFGVWAEIGRLSVGFGVFAIVVAYPWRDDQPGETARAHVFGRLVLTLIAAGTLHAVLGLVEQVAGNGNVLWVSDVPSMSGRASGPFVNPNHFAAWLEMIIPTALGYAVTLVGLLRGRLMRSIEAGTGIGVPRRRVWVAALVTHQQRLWPPVVAGAAVMLMGVAHAATGSRGGSAALFVGLAVGVAGIIAHRRRGQRPTLLWRWAPIALAGGLVFAGIASLAVWAFSEGEETAAVETADVSLASRFAVSAKGVAIVRDHPLFGAGMGSWLHAFRPYVSPPVEGGIWDHAHNDYLELAAESGLAGCLLVLLFAITVLRAVRGGRATALTTSRHRGHRAFERPDWAAALADTVPLRWGVGGGVVAILVHSLVDFSLRLPANFLLLMLLLALLLLSGRSQPLGRNGALVTLLAALAVGALPLVANRALVLAGGRALSPSDCLEEADLLLAEEGDESSDVALALLRHAIDRSPADREAHEALAEALGPGPEGDDALRRALALEPWSVELRDRLALRLLEEGDHAAGIAELEEAMYRFPSLVSHYYLSPELEPDTRDPAQVMRALAEGDTLLLRLASLDADTAGAVERGLRRALADAEGGYARANIVDDLVAVLEARERWQEAATLLASEGERTLDHNTNLARAAQDYLKARDYAAAEQTLVTAVMRTPERGELYRDLAVDVYAARGDFAMAEGVLRAGERNALDMLPVYDAVADVVGRRELARAEGARTPGRLRIAPSEAVIP